MADKQSKVTEKINATLAATLGNTQLKIIELTHTLEVVTEELAKEKERNEALEALVGADDE